MKKTLLIFVAICSLLLFMKFEVFAHDTNLGITGYDDIEYDDCIGPLEGIDNYNNGDRYGEKWYEIVKPTNYGYRMYHIDNDIETVYYQFQNNGKDDNTITWSTVVGGEKGEFIRSNFEDGIKKWNNVYYYQHLGNNVYTKQKIINIVNYDNLSQAEQQNVTISLYIYPTWIENSINASTSHCNSAITEDEQIFNGVHHDHYSSFYMEVNLYNLNSSGETNIERVGSHEFGHVLGLFDIDAIESGEYHHDEILMGYGAPRQNNITYKDIAGVSITRGLHDNNDHLWLYEGKINNEYKLICSLCNCVKYVDELNGYDYLQYHNCEHNFESLPTSLDEYMIPVASYDNTDYYKCKFCRYVAPFENNVIQNYVDTGIIYDSDNHLLYNDVNNLEYYLTEEHDFSILVAPGVYKCSGCDYCSDGSIYDEISLDCVSNNITEELSFDVNDSYLYEVDIDCTKSFYFKTSSLSETRISLVNSNDVNVGYSITNVLVNGSYENIFSHYLNPNTYYLKIEHIDSSSQDEVLFTYRAYYPEENVVNIGSSINCSSLHYHYDDSDGGYYHKIIKINNNYGPGMFKIELNGQRNNNQVMSYPAGMIALYSDSTLTSYLHKYDINTINGTLSENATNKANENNIIISLPTKGYYYCVISSAVNDYSSLSLSVSQLQSSSLNMFSYPEDDEYYMYNYFTASNGDNFKEIVINQACQVHLYAFYSGSSADNILFVLFEKKYVEGSNNNECTFNPIYYYNFNSSNDYDDDYIDLPQGVYYIGCFGNKNGALESSLFREISLYGSSVLISDPHASTLYGSQIGIVEAEEELKNRSFRCNYITVGFTRLLYIDSDVMTDNSRLHYYWYSSNPLVATVTNYGTVRGISVGTVKIMAVYAFDCSICFVKEMTIITDYYVNNTIVNNDPYDVDYLENTDNGVFRLELEKFMCPYPYYSLYSWTLTIPSGYNNFDVDIDDYAIVTVNGLGSFSLSGLYYMSNGNTITVNITINIIIRS